MIRASDQAAERGWPLLAYNPLLFVIYHVHARDSAPAIVAGLRAEFPGARTWVDVGAGGGEISAAARREGVAVVACEHSPFGRALARFQHVDARPFDLERRPPADVGSADLAFSFEVAEHLPRRLGFELVEFLVGVAPDVVFSAAPPGQGGVGHVNEQPREYWIEAFAAAGAHHDAAASERLRDRIASRPPVKPWYRDNAMVFRRRPA